MYFKNSIQTIKRGAIVQHQKSEYFLADEPIEFLLLASALSLGTILASAVLVGSLFFNA